MGVLLGGVETRRVYLSFFVARGWVVQFSPPELERALGRIRTLATEEAVRGIIERTPTVLSDDERRRLEQDLARGRGGVWLELTEEQYRKVCG